jgi:hypothetical protein
VNAWQRRPGFTASSIAAGNHLYFASSRDVFVVEANSKFTILATNRLGSLSCPLASDGTCSSNNRQAAGYSRQVTV